MIRIKKILLSVFFICLTLITWNATAAETPIMIVTGTVYESDGKTVASDGLNVEVTNITRSLNIKTVTGDAGHGMYIVTFIDFTGKNVAATGDEIEVVVTDFAGEELGKASHPLTDVDVNTNTTIIDIVSKRQPPWDVNGDLVVDISDLVIVGLHFGEVVQHPIAPNPDINRDGVVDISDLVLVGVHFGESAETAPKAPSVVVPASSVQIKTKVH